MLGYQLVERCQREPAKLGWDGPYHEVLAMEPKNVRLDWLNSGNAPFLNSHSCRRHRGRPRPCDCGQRIGIGRPRLRQGAAEWASPVGRHPRGPLKNISMGYRPRDGEAWRG
jgi:hypothetical protein